VVVVGRMPPAPDRCINVEEHFGVLGERRSGLEVLEFWEIFVRDLYGRFGNDGILCESIREVLNAEGMRIEYAPGIGEPGRIAQRGHTRCGFDGLSRQPGYSV
jgi:hypothetical protein